MLGRCFYETIACFCQTLHEGFEEAFLLVPELLLRIGKFGGEESKTKFWENFMIFGRNF